MTPTVITGKYNKAEVFTDSLENEAASQIRAFLDHEAFAHGRIAIMPDVHAGKGAVIGFTAALGDMVIPNVIGVDIGCGVRTWNIGERSVDFEALDRFIRSRIPSGRDVRRNAYEELEAAHERIMDVPMRGGHREFRKRLTNAAKETEQDNERVISSIGSLGGGNHFIEIDRDEKGSLWLTIHSGSRNFGLRIATHHQAIARKRSGSHSGLEFLTGDDREAYMRDMKTAQEYAALNRSVMGSIILSDFFKMRPDDAVSVESVHNYISFTDNIIRKGAISAHRDERVVIPFNMRDGLILGVGKGVKAWNLSAPHGAGRTMSRSRAKSEIKVDDFKKAMDGIWTSSGSRDTIDESPMAYKDADSIIDALSDTVTVTSRMFPVYNFKAKD